MNYIARMLGQTGDVVMGADEFPSCSLPWFQHGCTTKFVASQQNETVSIDQLAAAITPTTKAVVTSHVQYATGFRQDLEKLGALCRGRRVHLCAK